MITDEEKAREAGLVHADGVSAFRLDKITFLEKGDEVEIEERGELLLLCSVNKKIQKTQISISATSSLFPAYLLALYLKGYDEITVKFENSSVLSNLNLMIKEKVPGFSITDSGHDFCKIRAIEEGRKGDYESSIEKAISLLINYENNLIEIIASKDYARTKDLDFIGDSCLRVINFSLRNINKFGHKDYDNTALIYSAVESLLFILSELEDISLKIKSIKQEEKLSPEIVSYFKKMHDLLHKYYNLNINYKAENALKILNECTQSVEEIKILKNKKPIESEISFSLCKIFETIESLAKKHVGLNP